MSQRGCSFLVVRGFLGEPIYHTLSSTATQLIREIEIVLNNCTAPNSRNSIGRHRFKVMGRDVERYGNIKVVIYFGPRAASLFRIFDGEARFGFFSVFFSDLENLLINLDIAFFFCVLPFFPAYFAWIEVARLSIFSGFAPALPTRYF